MIGPIMAMTLEYRGGAGPAVDGSMLRPDLLRGRGAVEVAHMPLCVGNAASTIGEHFDIAGHLDDDHLVIEGDLRGLDGLARGLTGGRLTIRGTAGHDLGAGMLGGSIEVLGDAGDRAGAEMRGGTMTIRGNAGDDLGAALPGSRIGMREGVIFVMGDAGRDVGLSMRRGLIAVAGSVGPGAGRAMVAGSVFAFGEVGRHAGAGMKRGTVAALGPQPMVLPTFADAGRSRPPFLAIYLRWLRDRGFPVPPGAVDAATRRYNGDAANGGLGEIFVVDG